MTKDKTSRCKYLVHLLKTQLLWGRKLNNNTNTVVKDTIPTCVYLTLKKQQSNFHTYVGETFLISQNQFHFLLYLQNQLHPFCFHKTNSGGNKAITHINNRDLQHRLTTLHFNLPNQNIIWGFFFFLLQQANIHSK